MSEPSRSESDKRERPPLPPELHMNEYGRAAVIQFVTSVYTSERKVNEELDAMDKHLKSIGGKPISTLHIINESGPFATQLYGKIARLETAVNEPSPIDINDLLPSISYYPSLKNPTRIMASGAWNVGSWTSTIPDESTIPIAVFADHAFTRGLTRVWAAVINGNGLSLIAE